MPSTPLKRESSPPGAAEALALSVAGPAAPARVYYLSLALALTSAAGLAYEIGLTRVFSLLFQYHYAFLAVSLAVLGLGLGAATAAPLRRPGRWERDRLPLVVLAGLILAFPLVGILLARLPTGSSILPAVVIALLPFVLIGLFSALAFAQLPQYSGWLYGADLLGAAAGVVLGLGLLALGGAFNLVVSLGLVAALAAGAASLSDRHLPVWAPLAGLALGTLALAGSLAFGVADLASGSLAGAARDKTMFQVLADPARQARVVYTVWHPFARVDVVQTADPSEMLVFTDGGAGSYMIRFDGDLAHQAHRQQTVEFLPFTVAPAERVLVLGAGAGKDVLLALLAGAGDITAVEVNPAIVKATRHYSQYNGAILDRPEVTLVMGDGRAFVERSDERYDLIYLNLAYTQAPEPVSQSLAENYLFTREAFAAYLDRLEPDGRLAIVSHNALEASRAALTALQVLSERGVPPDEGLDHISLLMRPHSDPTLRESVTIVGRQPLGGEELQRLAAWANRLGLQPLHLPGLFEMPFAPLRQGATLEEFLAGDPSYDLRPTADDRPFFFKLDPGLPFPVRQALVASAALALALSAVAMYARRTEWAASAAGRLSAMLLYAALAGMGFMLLELPLIHQWQLVVGHPVLSLAIILTALLLAGGAGSWLSQRWPRRSLPRAAAGACLAIAALALAFRWLLPPATALLLSAAPAWGLAAAGLATIILGVPMGIPFPCLLRLASDRQADRVPLLWATNGACSVLGSTLAIAAAMLWGYSWAMVAGAAAYLLLAGVARWLR
ncbi:MAG: class I SAM-dependent methyltransferase [Anaerolineae bacterium]|nr:class I SAM-dependent methyltransferase [Anaerolineae bacterium]